MRGTSRFIAAGASAEGANPRRAMQPASFKWDVPAQFNFARDVIDALAPSGRRGLVFIDASGARRDFTFGEIADASQRWAAALRDCGIAHGDHVVVILPKSPQWLLIMTALLRLGAVAIPGAEQLRTKDVLFRAVHGDATTVVSQLENAAEVDAIRAGAPRVRRYLLVGGERDGWTALEPLAARAEPFAGNATAVDDLAYIVYTSGTTKDPKGVVHRVAYTFAKRMQAATWFDCTANDLAWCTSSTGWAKSLWNVLLGPWSCGAAIVVHEGGFTPESRLDLIRDLGVTLLCQAPTEYRLEAKLPDLATRWTLPCLRHCVLGRRTAQSRSDRALARRVRTHDLRRLRTNRKYVARREPSGKCGAAGIDGQTDPRSRRGRDRCLRRTVPARRRR